MAESGGGSPKKPTCIIVLGMAGSGKTTFVQRLTSDLYRRKTAPYVVNLDPACREVPYPANIDIRDTVNYKVYLHSFYEFKSTPKLQFQLDMDGCGSDHLYKPPDPNQYRI